MPFVTADNRECNVIQVSGAQAPTKGPVLLVHGAGVRANIFRAPTEQNIVEFLVAQGYDVWLENWRGSITFPLCAWDLDQVASYDHPAAVKTVCAETKTEEIKAIVHCQGSTSFMMSAVAGLVPQVKTIVSNAVSLHTIVPKGSAFKLAWTLPMLKMMTPCLNPHWGVSAPTLAAKFISALVALVHHECDNAVCKQVSFTYGSGFPALWSHENLNDQTHEWLKEEFGAVPISFFEQMARCVKAGHLLSAPRHAQLPADYVAQAPQTDARFALFAGENNLCFLPESQRATHAFLERHRPGFHSLHVIPNYGHLDIFMGQYAARDVFPIILQELDN